MTFAFVLEAEEVIHHTLLFQFLFLPSSWYKWLLFLLWKKVSLFMILCFFNPRFLHFLEINDFFFVLKGQEIIHNILLFQSIFLAFSWHKWLLFLFWKQGKSFITLRFFKPYFRYFLDINDLFSFWKHGNWFITLCYFSLCFLHFLDTN